MRIADHLGPALAALALALSVDPVLAQHRGAGGHRGGGGHGGRGGYAVARSGGGHRYGGVAGARHPRAGTGYGHYRGHYHGGYHGRYYGGHQRGYGYYGPYYGYRPYFYGSLYFGWPYDYWWPYRTTYPYDAGYSLAYYAPEPEYGNQARGYPPVRDAERYASPPEGRESGWLRLEVRPEDTSVYVDDRFRGSAREVRGLQLAPGLHTIELVRPGYVTELREIRIVTGERQDVFVELQRPR
jgi:hypothetical protein